MTENGLIINAGGNSSKLYNNPKYYEIAFSFRDIPAEVDLFEHCFKRFSRIPVRSVLELGCGNSPHMEELVNRGYQYSGLDLSKAMLEYSKEKAMRIGAEVKLIHADMNNFSLDTKVDFVYVMLGSLHVRNTPELIAHFDSVTRVLRKGGLYLLDWCIHFDPPGGSDDPPALSENAYSWEIERGGVKVRYSVSWRVINRVEQTFEETQVMEVDDRGKKIKAVEKGVMRAIYPQEFLFFVSSIEQIEFVGWWNNWDLDQPLEKAEKIDRPIVLVRRK